MGTRLVGCVVMPILGGSFVHGVGLGGGLCEGWVSLTSSWCDGVGVWGRLGQGLWVCAVCAVWALLRKTLQYMGLEQPRVGFDDALGQKMTH